MVLGLRIDVDTWRGTRVGVPNLLETLRAHGVKATFFFCVGPDNMGRHLWRLLRPAFLVKILRTRAASLYGWDILLRGTFWPGPRIGRGLAPVIRAAAQAGHEVGLHAWDHWRWQARLDRMDRAGIRGQLQRGMTALTDILGRPPACSATPAWMCNDAVLEEKTAFSFTFNSDCRGRSLFRPVVGGKPLDQPQIPTTLPTYDELMGRDGITAETYNDRLLSLLNPNGLNVLTIHAEAEGGIARGLFEDFLRRAEAKGIRPVPLGRLLAEAGTIPEGRLVPGAVAGREGWAAVQG